MHKTNLKVQTAKCKRILQTINRSIQQILHKTNKHNQIIRFRTLTLQDNTEKNNIIIS